MEKLKNTKVFLALLIVATFVIQSCSNADDVEPRNPDDPEGGITLYKVDGESITKEKDYPVTGSDLQDQANTQKHQEIWDLTKKIITPEYLAIIKEYVLYNGVSQESDAYVAKITDDLTQWQYGVAINYAYEEGFNNEGALQKSITHEFGHLLSLNDSQLDASISEANCPNYYPEDGCAKTGSFINTFYSTFWTDNLVKEFDNNSDNTTFFENNKDKFITEYAASSPIEDFAEVFAYFVLHDMPSSNSTAIKDLKILSFNEYPELVKIKTTIRARLNL
ncbi:putative zinc-binding metallopeptidase [Arcticibacterium luteifluviistationis]|uniref:Uncharacterized protein n=1 Tax=Arcticibacterium luteifluviistationis TaxID=1784714 RepID=A0A2Z4GGY5_9BACT|nr:putative zinc-binding metallopeptidase [Arcticibacterium luteifluviistationis]AWW00285.1 hypothetical protein DJ013_19755 [Arcticibacterium luteifluviistationis]